MKGNGRKCLIAGLALILVFTVWTILVQKVDVQPAGNYEPQKNVGFAGLNTWFHGLTGYSETLYKITDWLGLVPIAICIGFGILGMVQLIQRKSLLKVDTDIILLGIFYIVVIAGYLLFEKITINYRPVLVDGLEKPESSYPSSTTLLVLSVMPTLVFQAKRRIKNANVRQCGCRPGTAEADLPNGGFRRGILQSRCDYFGSAAYPPRAAGHRPGGGGTDAADTGSMTMKACGIFKLILSDG